MACCEGFEKYCLFFFNLLFALSGLGIIIVGGIALYRVDEWDHMAVGTDIKTAQIILIVVGVLTFVIATLGCCGAIRESKFMLVTFAILLLSIFIIEVAVGIFALVNFSQIKEEVAKSLGKEFQEMKNNTDKQKDFDSLQIKMECCGMGGKGDYLELDLPIPDSCCRHYKEDCAKDKDFWGDGCKLVLPEYLNGIGKLIGGVSIGLSLIEIIGSVLALRLVSKMGRVY